MEFKRKPKVKAPPPIDNKVSILIMKGMAARDRKATLIPSRNPVMILNLLVLLLKP